MKLNLSCIKQCTFLISKLQKLNKQVGFTVTELIVVLSIVATLLSLSFFSISGAQRSAATNTTIDTFISDLKQTQLKAMVGDSEGRATSDNYGLYLQTNQYTIFHGAAYNAADTSNVTIPYDNNLTMSGTSFPSSTVLFLKVSGEINGMSANSTNTITLTNTTNNQQKTITINRFGAIVSIN